MTKTTRRPVVLTIDDDDQNSTELKLQSSAEVLARTPDEVKAADLKRANVVLIDYQIDDWPGREEVDAIALRPGNGVALAAVLRSQTEGELDDKRRAFAIHSARLNDLSGGLPAADREHAMARALNLEWVFPKSKSQGQKPGPAFDVQVAALARAVKALPKTWPEDSTKAQQTITKLLATPTRAAWGKRAVSDADACHPPLHAWVAETGGMVVIRWLLHQVLPYPSFLWDDRYLAARLYVTVKSLRDVLRSEPKAERALEPLRYAGVLSEFLGDRWWRAGVEHLLWDWTSGDSFNAGAVRESVRANVSKNLKPLKLNRPVVCVDSQSYRPTDDVIDVLDAIEIKPDDWPPYAEPAWIPLTSAEDDGISALVVTQDRDRLEGES